MSLNSCFSFCTKAWKHLQQGEREKNHLAAKLGNTCSREKRKKPKLNLVEDYDVDET
jgi:hypothetical protein